MRRMEKGHRRKHRDDHLRGVNVFPHADRGTRWRHPDSPPHFQIETEATGRMDQDAACCAECADATVGGLAREPCQPRIQTGHAQIKETVGNQRGKSTWGECCKQRARSTQPYL